MEGDEQYLFLLFDHGGQLPLILSKLLSPRLIALCTFHGLDLISFLLEFLDPDYISLDLVVNNLHGCVTNLILNN